MHSFSVIAPHGPGHWIAGFADAFLMLPVAWQYAFACVLGLVIGSFLTVVVHRVPQMLEHAWQQELAGYLPQNAQHALSAESDGHDAVPNPAPEQRPAPLSQTDLPRRYNLWVPRSACTACGHTLRLHENIPLLSFITLRGRCSACSTRIRWRYPLIESACALFAALSLAAFGPTPTALIAFAFCAALLAMSAIDLETKLLPDSLTLPLLWAGLLINLHAVFAPLDAAVIGAAAGYLSLWAVYWLFKLVRGAEGIGYGDFKLFAAIGAWFGWSPLLQVILVASVCGAIVGLGATLAKRMRLEEPLPFGPFLAGAAVLTLFGGTPLYRLLGG
ncbi:Type 4 prepilin peptidase pilD [Mycetohabitans rhizoxinica HKI 454]|uniref:Prepilin leader peptidase/N-methyltransferase n=1 Tax=Mycetohabitans rhizoxinica (strain DSM 19002 / CIP 109453 / HKI 454) TaxID=882378 RepID=E5ALI2_MYCRK|nr:A24 family peptidase [Mycetohabitans sp. B6]CBW73855.1 Type 4 prepilin peptidase pilD [Mycetohabitans rhizoxinica HKI 454]